MSENLGTAVAEITGDASGAIRAIDSTQSHLGASIFIFRTAGYALQAIGQAAMKGFSDASQASADFNAKLVQISNLTGIVDFDINKVHDTILKLAVDTGRTPQELADGFYYAASVLNNLNDALTVTTIAAKGAAIGLGTTAEITKTLTSIMNVYGFTAKDVNGVMNTLVIAVKDGAGEVDQFAGAVGRIIPVAKVAGVSFNDVAAALATATRAGLSVDEATTAVNRTLVELIGSSQQTNKELFTLGFSQTQVDDAMQALALATGTITTKLQAYGVSAANADKILTAMMKSTDKGDAAMKKYGLTAAQMKVVNQDQAQGIADLNKKLIPYGLTLQDIAAVLHTYTNDTEKGRLALGKFGISSEEIRKTLAGPNGLYNALTMIMKATGGNEAELRRIFPNIRGLIGILATAGTQGVEYKSILDEMNGSLNTTDVAFNKAAQTQQFANQQYKAALDVLKIRVGEAMAPTMIAVLHALIPLLQSVSDFAVKHPTAFKNITLGLLGLAGAFTVLGGAMQAAAGMIAITRSFGWIFEHAGDWKVLATGIEGVGKAFMVAGAFMLTTGGAIVLLIAGIIAIGILLYTHWDELSTLVRGFGELLGTFFVEVWTKVKNAIGGFFDWLGTQVHDKVTAVGNAFSAFGTRVHSIWDGIVNGVKAMVMAVVKWFMDTPEHLGQAAHAIGFFIGHMIRTNILDPFDAVVKFFTDLPGNLAILWFAIPIVLGTIWDIAVAAVTERAKLIWSTIVGYWNKITGDITYFGGHWKSILGGAWEGIKKAVMDKVSSLWTWLTTTWNGISKGAKAVWDNMPAIAQTAWQVLRETVKGVLTLLKDDIIGPNGIWQKIIDYLKNLGNRLFTIAKDIAGQFWQGIKDGLEKHSPSNVERAFMDIADTAIASVGTVRDAISSMNASIPQIRSSYIVSSSNDGRGGANQSGGATHHDRGGASVGPIAIYNPATELDIISALQRAQYLARMTERGIAPGPIGPVNMNR